MKKFGGIVAFDPYHAQMRQKGCSIELVVHA